MCWCFATTGRCDRTTSGKGRVCDITYDSIRRCVLKTGHGVKTTHRMPTLREALEVCKDRIVVNVDQGYEYYDLVLAVTEELGVTDQILIKGKRSTDAVAAKFAEHPRNMMYMPIIDILKPQGRALFAEYQEKGIAPLAYEVCWNKYTPEVKECMDKVVAGGSKLWVNSLWALALRRAGLTMRPSAATGGSLREAGRHGGHDDPDGPSRTADILPPLARAA